MYSVISTSLHIQESGIIIIILILQSYKQLKDTQVLVGRAGVWALKSWTPEPYTVLSLWRHSREQDSAGMGFCQVGEQWKEREERIVEEVGMAVTTMMGYGI